MLERYCAEDGLHALLLNTLSMLEHIGSRKIMMTQSRGGVDQPTLRHLAEETRHALFFKRLAEKIAGHGLDYSNLALVAPTNASMYLQRLDACVANSLGHTAHPKAPYLYMSLVVEFRAVWFYRIYQTALKSRYPTLSLKGILGDEEGHLKEMAGSLEAISAFDSALIQRFCIFEQVLFKRLLGGFESNLQA